jgi:hydroxymethylpyrimidine pyrophosphatase-like HAD family hydrolase
MPVACIIADVDGCLTPEESIAWDLEHFAQFARRAREASAGVSSLAPLTLCTGRPQPYAEVLMKLLDVRAPAICENGAVFYTLADNRAWYARGVTEEKLLGLRDVRAFIETELLPAQPAAVLQFGKESQISIFSDRPEVLPPMQPLIEGYARRSGGPDLVVNCSHYYLNISLAGIDKGAAIGELLEVLGVGRDRVAGIGDTEGDLPLREAVGFFACPANARQAIKAVADYVSPHPLLEGVLDILDRPECQRG